MPQARLHLDLGQTREVTVSWPAADRLTGGLRRDEETMRPFLPVASPVLVSPCGWHCTPRPAWGGADPEFLSAQPEAHLTSEARVAWAQGLVGQAQALTGSQVPLLRSAAHLLAEALRARGHTNLDSTLR